MLIGLLRWRVGFLLVWTGAMLALMVWGVSASPPPPPDPFFVPSEPSPLPLAPASFRPLSLGEPHPPRLLPCPAWRIGITADGLYRIPYEALASAGVPLNNVSALHLLWRGQEVAIEVEDGGDGSLGPGDALIFYGQKFHGSVQDEKYTDENVYWLVVDAGALGSRMETRPVSPGAPATPLDWYTATAHFEQNVYYWARWSVNPRTEDTWFWDYLTAASPLTRTYPLTLTAVVTEGYMATLTVELAGRTENFHRIGLAINGSSVGETIEWGKVGWTATLTFPSTFLQEGPNLLAMQVFTDGGHQQLYLNWVELTYRRRPEASGDVLSMTLPISGPALITATGFTTSAVRLYDITDPLKPVRLTGASISPSAGSWVVAFRDEAPAGTAYLLLGENAVNEISTLTRYCPPEGLLSSPGADEIIIAPSAFITAVRPLAEHRQAQGLRVEVVPVDDLYNLFNDGIFHPEAIRSFVAYAYENWPGPHPSFLLLVGDGHFNFKGYNTSTYGIPTPVWIPPYLQFADPWQGEVPVDSLYGDVDGDGFPEVAVGRIPAGSVEEVEGAVAKILAYESQSLSPTEWQQRVILSADNVPDSAGDFLGVAQALAKELPAGMLTSTIYLNDYCGRPVSPPQPCPSATLALTITWSEGASLLTYVGHAAVNRWAHEPLLRNTELASLTGTEGLPFLISLDCWDGYWMFPPKYPGFTDTRSIGEWATTVLTDRGAIAAFGPAGLGRVNEEHLMAQAMYRAMFQEGKFQLGPLTQVGREAVPFSHLARTYTLLGDPALWLPWWAEMSITPALVTVTAGSTVSLPALFTVTATTRFGQVFVVTPTWTVGMGTLDGWGIYTAPQVAALIPVTAHLGPLSAGALISITSTGPTPESPRADFYASPTSGPVPLTVVFTNTSTGDYESSLWDFGDGVTSTLTHPQHTYTVPGLYTVTLTVRGEGGEDTLIRQGYIRAEWRRVYLPLILRNR